MTVAEMIEKLQKFPQDMEVQITDGFQYKCYKGDFSIDLFTEVDNKQIVDIGIGGFDYE